MTTIITFRWGSVLDMAEFIIIVFLRLWLNYSTVPSNVHSEHLEIIFPPEYSFNSKIHFPKCRNAPWISTVLFITPNAKRHHLDFNNVFFHHNHSLRIWPSFCGFKLGFNQHTHRFSAPIWHVRKWNPDSLTYKAAAWDDQLSPLDNRSFQGRC